MQAKYQIGQKFRTRNKWHRVCTVRDILTTTNSAGEVVRIRYVATHEFLGQTVTDSNVAETTISMGLVIVGEGS